MNKPNYTILTPFKRWTIQNFPFIEEDFDAITNYQLLCKIVEYLNKVIENEKLLEQSNNELIDAFNNLKSYVDNYFEELDVQDEINNKLDEMADSGQLTDIIAQYLGLAGVLAFNTIDDLADALNITNGSICYCLGDNTYNDGKGAFYKIRTVTSGDVVDGFNIVALDVSDTLIAERMPNYYIESLNSSVSTLNSNVSKLQTKFTKMLTFGDSWTGNELNADGTGTLANPSCNWADLLSKTLGLTLENYAIGGYGITGDTNNLRAEIDRALNNISLDNRDNYKYIFIMMGVNDWQGSNTIETIQNTLSTDLAYLKTNFPNTQIILIPLNFFAEDLDQRARNIYSACLIASLGNNVSLIPNFYNFLNMFGTYYYKDESSISPSHPYAHPNDSGHRMIKTLIAGCLNGKAYPVNFPLTFNNELSNITLSSYVITSDTQTINIHGEITIKANTTISALTWYDLGHIQYGGNNIYVRRYPSFKSFNIYYGDSFVELQKEYFLLVYITNDGRIRLLSKRAFTPTNDVTLNIDHVISRLI